jgi:hypothetical protein
MLREEEERGKLRAVVEGVELGAKGLVEQHRRRSDP